MKIGILSIDELIQEFDDFERRLKEDPTDKTLLNFFIDCGIVMTKSKYKESELEQIRTRIDQLNQTIYAAKKELSRKSNMLLKAYNGITKYNKTSNINNTKKWN